ncbi:MAG: rRNA (pseudouridine1915-N3)-methyltransferase [Acidobacteriota bacterium]|jgi:23S rRNA (pseudouridine1915-N3)-methyltransferase|nr:rRNA (pseudouridine1915-N3)-methyltransferase [Acidobacteriota bacterium]
MKFRVLWVRSNADSEFAAAIDRYVNRIRHFFPIEVTEIAAERGRQSESDVAIMRAESARLMAALPAQGHVTVLDERGRQMDSLKFSKWLERMTIEQPHGVSFVMGGDVGLADTIKQRADTLLALSAMTLPHQIARVVLLEQIYRACTLMRNIPYHK